MDMMQPAMMAQPMRTARGPKRLRRMEKMGEKAAAAMLFEPKLRVIDVLVWLGNGRWDRGLQEAVGETSSLEEPFINVANRWGEKEAASDAVEETLGHDDL